MRRLAALVAICGLDACLLTTNLTGLSGGSDASDAALQERVNADASIDAPSEATLSIRVVKLFVATAPDLQPVAEYDPLTPGMTVHKNGHGPITVVALTDPASVGSVGFEVDGDETFNTENTAPYVMTGDTEGTGNAWRVDLGDHTITATPFGAGDRTGGAGTPLTVKISVVQ
jgi:hypothetical protein